MLRNKNVVNMAIMMVCLAIIMSSPLQAGAVPAVNTPLYGNNFDFSSGTDGWIWCDTTAYNSTSTDYTYRVDAESEPARGGFLELENLTTTGKMKLLSDKIAVKGGSEYKLSFSYNTNAGIDIGLVFMDVGGSFITPTNNLLSVSPIFTNLDTATKYFKITTGLTTGAWASSEDIATLTSVVAPQQAVWAKIVIRTQAAEIYKVRYDDVCLRTVGTERNEVPILNADFLNSPEIPGWHWVYTQGYNYAAEDTWYRSTNFYTFDRKPNGTSGSTANNVAIPTGGTRALRFYDDEVLEQGATTGRNVCIESNAITSLPDGSGGTISVPAFIAANPSAKFKVKLAYLPYTGSFLGFSVKYMRANATTGKEEIYYKYSTTNQWSDAPIQRGMGSYYKPTQLSGTIWTEKENIDPLPELDKESTQYLKIGFYTNYQNVTKLSVDNIQLFYSADGTGTTWVEVPVVNSGFEDPIKIPDWEFLDNDTLPWNTANLRVDHLIEFALNGKPTLYFRDNNAASGLYMMSNRFGVSAGTNYTSEVYGKTSNITYPMNSTLLFFDVDGNVLNASGQIVGSDSASIRSVCDAAENYVPGVLTPVTKIRSYTAPVSAAFGRLCLYTTTAARVFSEYSSVRVYSEGQSNLYANSVYITNTNDVVVYTENDVLGQTVTFNAEAFNGTSHTQSVKLIRVAYSSGNALEAIHYSAAISIRPGETKKLTGKYIMADSNSGFSYKFFVWDDSGNIKPLSNTYTLQ